MSSSANKPRDGPATFFPADPLVLSVYNRESDYFDLVLVAGWPLLEEEGDLKAYGEFLQRVKSCFSSDPQDELEGDRPTVLLYEPPHLHVTIATFYPIEKQKKEASEYDAIKAYFLKLLESASRRPEWPKEALQLQIESTQLGSKAGVLLWKDLTDGVAKMRECLIAAEQEQQEQEQSAWKIDSIPGIIHSSFLRFSQQPKTNGEVLQEQYQSKVIPAIHKIFDRAIKVSKIHLVYETTPYMYLPKEGPHVLSTIDLTKAPL
jgi:hypothetical protein